jgi:hypothetical protein
MRPDDFCRVRRQCFFCACVAFDRALLGTDPDGDQTGAGFFGCFGFFASRLLRN